MMKRKILPILLSLVLLSTGCAGTTETTSPSTSTDSSIKEDEEELEITGIDHIGIREYTTLACTFDGKVISPEWSSSNKKIATISTKGMVKGLALGEVTITATYNGHSAKFALSVTESWALSSVVSRINKGSYQVSVCGDGGLYDSMSDPSFAYEVYSNGIYYHSANHTDFIQNCGIGYYEDKLFSYTADEKNVIDSAMILRNQTVSLSNCYYGLGTLSSNYYQMDLREDNTYDMTTSSAATYLEALYFMMGTQFVSSTQTDFMTELQKSIVSLTMKVENEYAFTATLGFGTKEDDNIDINTTITLYISSIEDKTCPIIDNYLKTNTPVYPSIYPAITKMYELSKSHNYIRSLGTYTGINISIPIGNGIFTENYAFTEYTDDYIEETKDSYTENPLCSHGYIDIHGKEEYEDGSYAFTVVDGKVVLGSRVLNNQGKFYSHWYEFYENLTLILEMLESDFYTFESVKTGEALIIGEFASYSPIGASITEDLFSSYLEMDSNLKSSGILLHLDYSDSNPSSSIANIGGLFSYNGNLVYQYSKYPYTNFNKASSPLLDTFLSSLTDK